MGIIFHKTTVLGTCYPHKKKERTVVAITRLIKVGKVSNLVYFLYLDQSLAVVFFECEICYAYVLLYC